MMKTKISFESEEEIDAENMEEEIILERPPPKNQGFFPKYSQIKI